MGDFYWELSNDWFIALFWHWVHFSGMAQDTQRREDEMELSEKQGKRGRKCLWNLFTYLSVHLQSLSCIMSHLHQATDNRTKKRHQFLRHDQQAFRRDLVNVQAVSNLDRWPKKASLAFYCPSLSFLERLVKDCHDTDSESTLISLQ